MIIKWVNKYSHEEGYVKSINRKERHFENTFDTSEAKVFGNTGAASMAIKTLRSYGEGDNNDFEILR